VRDQTAIDRLTANVPNPFAGLIPDTSLNGSTVARSQLLKAFPQFSGVTEQSMNHGSSYFHLLQVRLEKRFSHGLQLLANYSYSKLLERASLLNAFDAVPEQRVADEDRPQRFIVSASYELPFGRGKAIAGNAGRVWNQMIGGWVVNSIYTRQLGQALSWGNVIYYGGPLNLDARNIDHAFDTTQFNTNSKQQLDQNIRTFPSRFGNLRGDGVNNFDLSAIKNFTLREPLKLQYRAEFFNALNHPTFSSPNTSVTSSNFGYITGQANLPRTIQMALRLIW
jgi:hypothetical protein